MVWKIRTLNSYELNILAKEPLSQGDIKIV
jgi:hypothetical protein